MNAHKKRNHKVQKKGIQIRNASWILQETRSLKMHMQHPPGLTLSHRQYYPPPFKIRPSGFLPPELHSSFLPQVKQRKLERNLPKIIRKIYYKKFECLNIFYSFKNEFAVLLYWYMGWKYDQEKICAWCDD